MGAADSPAELDDLPLGAAAEWYAARRLSVFPCRPRGKEPLVPGGFRAATADLAAIREWWRRWPAANIGIPTGRVTGWLVIDIDPRNGGDETIESWLARYGRWPPTAEAISGGGGRHVVFRYAGGLRCGALAPGVDLKADGGYVIVAPSVHPSGNRYSWDGLDGAEALDRLAEAPGWLLRLARERRRAEAETGAADRPPISEGARNDTLFRLAAALRAKGLGQAAITAALLAENAERCRPPLPEEEVRRIAESAGRYPAGGSAAAPGGIDPGRAATAQEALAALNLLDLWKTLRWRSWRRRGDLLIGETSGGAEVRIPARKLLVFDACAAEIMASTGVAIVRPRKGQVRGVWAGVAELIHRAASGDVVATAPPEAELRADMRRCWELAGSPAPATGEELYALLEALRGYVRRPHEATAPPAVFWWAGRWHVRLDVLRLWLSTPAAAARFARIDELEQGAALLGFAPHSEQLQPQVGGDRIRMRTWSAPPEALEDAADSTSEDGR